MDSKSFFTEAGNDATKTVRVNKNTKVVLEGRKISSESNRRRSVAVFKTSQVK